jgi:hypothetical protein
MGDIKNILSKLDSLSSESSQPKTLSEGAGVANIASSVGKKAARAIPFVGTPLAAHDAYNRWQKGDKTGAAISGLASAAYLVPGVGTTVGGALDAANIGRDIKAGEYDDLADQVKNVFKEKDSHVDQNDKLSQKRVKENYMQSPEKMSALKNKLDELSVQKEDRVDEVNWGDLLRRGANLFRRDPGITPVKPIPNAGAAGAARPAAGTTRPAASTAAKPADDVIDIKARDVTDRQVPAVRPSTQVSTQMARPSSQAVPFKRQAQVPPWAVPAALGGGAAVGYMAQPSDSKPAAATPATTSTGGNVSSPAVQGFTPGMHDDPDKVQSVPVPPREPIATVNTQTEPERPFAAPPAGSGLRARDSQSFGDKVDNLGSELQGSALKPDFVQRTTPQGFRFSPEQEEWLTRGGGNPNRQDPYILSRMLKKAGGPKPPLSYFKNPEDREIAKRLGFPEVPLDESSMKSVNRLSRKFENYIENKFGLIENNYIPKKKKFKVEATTYPNAQDPNTQITSTQQQKEKAAQQQSKDQRVDVATAKNTMAGLKNILGPSLDINQAASAVVKINDQKPLTGPEQQAMSALTPLIAKAAETPQTASNLKTSLSNAGYLAKIGK